ncbi:MAG: SDR family NAD(P)-dependent oxidoreductase [Proteobacteria bacterium]|nr:SDR family NAD(P)-dependent oxidoreductase [Pseudomonadota bacterium]
MRLQNRVAVITGAASGIGRASADLFAAEGANVLAVDLPGQGLNEAHKDRDNIATLEQNVADKGAPGRIIEEVTGRFGRLDIVFNNAGVSRNELAELQSEANWDLTLDVNLKAQFLLIQAAIPHLKVAPAGRIINTASVMARMTDYGLIAYCASKAGVAGMTRTLALELGKYGITANYIEPGAIYTGLTRKNFEDEKIAGIWARKAALRRLGQPIDIARGALFLASDDAGFVSGHGLVVDGGLTLRT